MKFCVDFLPSWSSWAASHQSTPESCSCTPRTSWSASQQSCSCRTWTRGNKCRRRGTRVQSLARWSSPSSASWTSCRTQTARRRGAGELSWTWRNWLRVLLRAQPAEMLTRVSTWRETTVTLRRVSSQQAAGAGLCCEGHEWVRGWRSSSMVPSRATRRVCVTLLDSNNERTFRGGSHFEPR